METHLLYNVDIVIVLLLHGFNLNSSFFSVQKICLFKIILFYMYWGTARCMSVHRMHTMSTEANSSLKLELQTVLSCDSGAGN